MRLLLLVAVFGLLLTQCFEVSSKKLRQDADFEDNEFAEFEDFEDADGTIYSYLTLIFFFLVL